MSKIHSVGGRQRSQLDTLFLFDSAGSMVRVNEIPVGSAPRIFVSLGDEGYLIRYRVDVLESVRQACDDVMRAHTSSQMSTVTLADELAARLAEHGSVENRFVGPAYLFPAEMDGVSVETVSINESNAERLADHLPDLVSRMSWSSPAVGVVADGSIVSACYSARSSVHASEAGVDTAPAFRGKGFASDAVRTWATAVRYDGREPLYSTWWENDASLRVAQKLGLIQYAETIGLT